VTQSLGFAESREQVLAFASTDTTASLLPLMVAADGVEEEDVVLCLFFHARCVWLRVAHLRGCSSTQCLQYRHVAFDPLSVSCSRGCEGEFLLDTRGNEGSGQGEVVCFWFTPKKARRTRARLSALCLSCRRGRDCIDAHSCVAMLAESKQRNSETTEDALAAERPARNSEALALSERLPKKINGGAQ
jgi:hypothetical protein